MDYFSMKCETCHLEDKAQTWEALEKEMKEHAALDHWECKELWYTAASAMGMIPVLIEREPIESPAMIQKLYEFDVMIEGIK